jgi:hypothetical protein
MLNRLLRIFGFNHPEDAMVGIPLSGRQHPLNMNFLQHFANRFVYNLKMFFVK